jgi:hypothetical protein
MNLKALIQQLAADAGRVRELVDGVTDEQAHWKPAPDSWSILEVINHLYDEEREDFRVRLEYILERPGKPWPPIAPQEWVTTREYNFRDLTASLENYLEERHKSLDWLETLGNVDWEKAEKAPWGGVLKAGDMLAAWVAHDIHAMRQLSELHYAWTQRMAEPYSVEYAGEW